VARDTFFCFGAYPLRVSLTSRRRRDPRGLNLAGVADADCFFQLMHLAPADPAHSGTDVGVGGLQQPSSVLEYCALKAMH
jgi:hypothetical protein